MKTVKSALPRGTTVGPVGRNLRTSWNVVLTWILKKYCVFRIQLAQDRGPIAGYRERHDIPSRSTKYRVSIHLMSNHQLQKEDFAPAELRLISQAVRC